MAELTGQLEAKQSEFDAAVGDSREEAAALAGRVAELSDQLEAKVAEAKTQEAEAAERIAGLEGQVVDLSGELEAKEAEVASRVQAMEDRIGSLEAELADARARLDAKNAGFETTTAQLREESDALAGRVAELSSQAEVVAAQLATAEAKAARIDPLSHELTKAQVALAAQRGDVEKLVGLADISRQLRERVAVLEQELHEARVDEVEMAKLRTQVAGLKNRADQAEQAAAFADEQLAQIIADVESAESEAIRRAAAAEAARIRELTEDSLGIARGHTAGTGLDADDYTGVAVTSAEFSADPEDWSDIFAAADAAAARLAGQPEVTESDIAAFVAEVAAPEPVETASVPVADPTEDEGVGDDGPNDLADQPADVEAGQDVDVPADEVDPASSAVELIAGPTEDEWTGDDGPNDLADQPADVEAGQDVDVPADEVDPASSAVELIAEPEPAEQSPEAATHGGDEGELPDFVAMIEEATPFATVDDLVQEPDESVAEEAADADTADVDAEIVAEAQVGETPDDHAATAVDETPADGAVDALDEQPVAELVAEVPVAEVVEASVDALDEQPVAEVVEEPVEVVAEVPVAEVVEEPVGALDDEQPVAEVVEESAEAEVPVAEVVEEPVGALDEQPVAEGSDQHPVDDPVSEDEPAPVAELSGDALEAAWAEFESAGPGDSAAVETAVSPVAEVFESLADGAGQLAGATAALDHTDDAPTEAAVVADEVVPAEMAERLRLARAEIEAELDPATLPPQQIASPPAAELVPETTDDSGFADEGVITRKPTETRYARQSAKLPRISDSEESEADGVSSMSRFRARMLRGKGKDSD